MLHSLIEVILRSPSLCKIDAFNIEKKRKSWTTLKEKSQHSSAVRRLTNYHKNP